LFIKVLIDTAIKSLSIRWNFINDYIASMVTILIGKISKFWGREREREREKEKEYYNKRLISEIMYNRQKNGLNL